VAELVDLAAAPAGGADVVTVKVADYKPAFEEVTTASIFGILAARGCPRLRGSWIRARRFRHRLATLRLLGAQHLEGRLVDTEPMNFRFDLTAEPARGCV
jgi:hypothetical protein